MIFVILGQTASGKTSLATKISKEFSLPLINSDAFQCYKELSIGTAKPTSDELEGVEHYFIDDRSITSPIDVKQFQEEGRKIIDNLISQGKDIIISGGTSLYIRALLFPFEFPTIDESKREIYENDSIDNLLSFLKEKDVETYNIIDKSNKRRIITALLLAEANQSRKDLINKNDNNPIYPCVFLNVAVDKDLGNELINKRVDQMFEVGLKKEVEYILKNYDNSLNALKAIGYREFINRNIDNEIEDIKNEIKLHTRQYAKRQRTFIRTQFNNVLNLSKEEIYYKIKIYLGLKERTKLLLGNENITLFEKQKVLVCGVGGVGSLIPSLLSRIGVKEITVIDNDTVNPSNINRQMFYTLNDLDKLKVDVIKNRLSEVNPFVNVTSYSQFIKSLTDIPNEKFTFIFDCIDSLEGKCSIYKFSKEHNIPLIISGGLGKRIDSTKVKIGKLKETQDPLTVKFKELLLERGENLKEIESLNVVMSNEARVKNRTKTVSSICTVPNSGGLAMVSYFINYVLSNGGNKNVK